jgi:anaerobic selenocysteine-containing dehydrogenase
MKRREFIKITGLGATSASLLSACGHPEKKLIPAWVPDEEYVPGIDYWKASTCGMCPAGCGIIVRTREHKANKIEGNPLHPVNRGALCARGQAGLEVLYNPDRIKGPLKRVGERGEGKWEEISWDEAIKALAEKLREIDSNSATANAQIITADADNITHHIARRFLHAFRLTSLANQPDPDITAPRGLYEDFLSDTIKLGEPIFDISNATYLISFRARFLETWKSPVMYSLAYGEFRGGRGKARGRFVHIEPRMSLTAANADEWVAAAPGTEALVALAMVQVIVREGLNKAPVSLETLQRLAEVSPESTASVTDVPAEKLIRLAREFARAERALAIGDIEPPGDAAINLLNAIVGNLKGSVGGQLVENESPVALPKVFWNRSILPGESDSQNGKSTSRHSMQRKINVLEPDQPPYDMLMIHGFNPMFEDSLFWLQKLSRIPFIVCFSSVMDETSELADLILPDHSYLESWGIRHLHAPNNEKALSLEQPVIEPQHNTRQSADVLLAVARELGGEVAAALPFESAKDIVEKSATDFLAASRHDGEGPSWNELTEKGVVTFRSTRTTPQTGVQAPILVNTFRLQEIRRDASEYAENTSHPLTLIVYEHAALGFGMAANLPSIQELPDPMTSVVWGSWVEINPRTATSLGIADGDLVEVNTEHGSLRAPAVLYPAIRPDVIAMPSGQGHTNFGRYATNRGANSRELNLRPQQSVGAKVSKVIGKENLIRFGTDLQERMEKKPWRQLSR